MYSICHYNSPLGGITLASDEEGLTGLWFDGQKYFGSGILKDEDLKREASKGEGLEDGRVQEKADRKNQPVLKQTVKWLDIYFAGQQPDFMPPLHMMGTPFRQKVWQILLDIPYGKTITYGEIARILAKEQGDCPMSAQAVGNAVGHNEISIVIPCHRVVGAKGNLVGYAGGIERKIALLKLEQVDMSKLYMPKFSKYSLRS